MKIGVDNIGISPAIPWDVEKIDVEEALKQNWSIKTDNINVKVLGKKVL